MTEDKKPGLTRRCKVQTWLFDMKLVTLAAFFVGGMIASIRNGQLGLWGEWYILGPMIVLWTMAPMRRPDKEYEK